MTRSLDAAPGRQSVANLVFTVGGGRTVLSRQHVPYPFHVTRPFRLDPARPDLATLYLQSASGGLYRADDLSLALTAGAGTAAHVVTQAATVVHDTGVHPARHRTRLIAHAGAVLAYTPDPLVLFPGAAVASETRITLAPSARVIVSDAFVPHDPQGRDRAFGAWSQHLVVEDESGRVLVRDAGRVTGAEVAAAASPLGPFRACGTMLVLAAADVLPAAAALRAAAEVDGAVGGVSTLPNAAGLVLRCLATEGGAVRRGLEAAFAVAFTSLVGVAPAPRRR